QSGGISLESIFIDEGFGTLDQETLETALDTLLNLKSTGRMVGIDYLTLLLISDLLEQ
ncbi:hypothetical protein IDG70_05395, partial [Staphylococcus sp. EG-SA-26]|nr:hypothetical protein [Staphylococcus sp. EG-SA-26]